MSAQVESKIIMCSVHDEKPMVYVCSTCRDILICSRCKNTLHESHKLKDIKKVAQEKLNVYREADNSVKTQFTAMLKTLKNLRSHKANMQQSIENANTGVDEIVRHLQDELKASVDVQKQIVETFASKSSDMKLEGEIRDVEVLLPELRRSHRELIHMLGKGVSDHEICHKVSLIEESKRICEKASKIMQHAANRSSTIYLPVQSKIDAVSKVMTDVLKQSQPLAVQTVDTQDQHSYARDLAFVHMIEIAKASPQTIICALHIAEDDCIVAVYGERQLDAPSNKGERKDTAMFGVFGANGLQKLSKTIELRDERNPAIYTASNKRVTVFCPKSETKEDVFDLGTFFDENRLNKKSSYYFKKENKVSLLSKSYKIYRVSTSTESPDEHVLTVSIDSPQQVVGDQAGNMFAIIHQTVVKENKTQKTLKVVQVFRKPQQGSAANPGGVIGNNMDRFEPVDLCFYQKDPNDVPVLLVATCENILVVNLKDLSPKDCFSLGYWLPNREPLLPTAMTTDRKGQLWVGCKGGKVLCCMPLEVVTNQLYSLPVEGEAGVDEKTERDWPDDEINDDDDESQPSSERASSVTTKDQDTASTDCSSDSQSREYKNEFPQSFNVELKAKAKFRKKRISGGNMSDSQQKKSVSDSASTASTEQLEQGEDKPLYLVPIEPSMPGQLQPLPYPLLPHPPDIVSALGPDQQQQEQEEAASPPQKPPRRIVSEHFPSIPPVRLQRVLSQPPASKSHVDATYFISVVSPIPSAATLQVTHSRQQQQQQRKPQQQQQQHQQQQQQQHQQQQTPIDKDSEKVQHQAPDATSGTTTQPQQQQMPQYTSWFKEQQNEQAPGTNEPRKSQPQHGPPKSLRRIAPKPPKRNLPAGASIRNVAPSGDVDVTKVSVKDRAKVMEGKLGFEKR